MIFYANVLFSRTPDIKRDETIVLKKRLLPQIAHLLETYDVKVFRIMGQGTRFLAETRYAFMETSIWIDYDILQISSELENFIIAHELSHVRRRDPLLKILWDCLLVTIPTVIAINITYGQRSIYAAILGAIVCTAGVIIGVVPISKYIRNEMEVSADDFASKCLDPRIALDCLDPLCL